MSSSKPNSIHTETPKNARQGGLRIRSAVRAGGFGEIKGRRSGDPNEPVGVGSHST
jgi:hypothetical protein